MKGLKIISFYSNEKSLVKKAASGYPDAQRKLYEQLAPRMLGVCRQYIKDLQFAEDVMISGFVKVFKKLDTFRFEGSFEGWVKRIMIRESISYLRKNQFVVFDDEVYEQHAGLEISDPSPFQVDFIQKLIDQLPEGYKMVFVLFAVEGYSHAEIAKLLNISENTSKSQLYKARRVLQKKLNAQEKRGYGTH